VEGRGVRYYLDTNILIFILIQDHDNVSHDVQHLLADYSNRFYVSSVAVQELIHIYKAGNILDKDYKSVKELFDAMEDSGIEIVPMNKFHLLQYAALQTISGHKDPNDHVIISQAISDKIPIISSDRKFKEYIGQGLRFIFNRR